MRSILHVLTVSAYFLAAWSADEKANKSVFVPTAQWQTVERGTPLPAGLHIRHNFETRQTEAKLLDPEDSESQKKNKDGSSTHLIAVEPDETNDKLEDDSSQRTHEDPKQLKFSRSELKEKLAKIRSEETGVPPDIGDLEPQQSSDELRKKLKSHNVNVTNDSELLAVFIEQFFVHKDAVTSGELSLKELDNVMDALNNLEYLLHQIDNAQIFAKMGGMMKVVSPCLNSTNDEIKTEGLRVLGTSVQSNPKVQANALENDFVQKLLHMLTTNDKAEINTKCLFALGSLVRQFPTAQKALTDHGGLEVFTKILAGEQQQTQIRLLKLINDLLIERLELDDALDLEARKEKSWEYSLINFEEKLMQQKYCKYLGNLMVKTVQSEIANELNTHDHDFVEVIFESMITAGHICKDEFRNDRNVLEPAIDEMLSFSRRLDAKFHAEDDVFRHLISLMEKIRRTLFEKSHDEL